MFPRSRHFLETKVPKEVQITFPLEAELRDAFASAAAVENTPATQVLRQLMQDYVLKVQAQQKARPQGATGTSSMDSRVAVEELRPHYAVDMAHNALEIGDEMQTLIENRVNTMHETHANNLIEGIDIGSEAFEALLSRAREPISDEEFERRELLRIHESVAAKKTSVQ